MCARLYILHMLSFDGFVEGERMRLDCLNRIIDAKKISLGDQITRC